MTDGYHGTKIHCPHLCPVAPTAPKSLRSHAGKQSSRARWMKGASCSAASSVMSNSYLEHPFRHLEHAFSTGFLQIPYEIPQILEDKRCPQFSATDECRLCLNWVDVGASGRGV